MKTAMVLKLEKCIATAESENYEKVRMLETRKLIIVMIMCHELVNLAPLILEGEGTGIGCSDVDPFRFINTGDAVGGNAVLLGGDAVIVLVVGGGPSPHKPRRHTRS